MSEYSIQPHRCPFRFFTQKHVADALGEVEYNLALHDSNFKTSWRDKPIRHHLWKAFKHVFRYSIGDSREPHLTHAATRLMFALQLAFEKNPLLVAQGLKRVPGNKIHYGVGRNG